MVEPLRIDMATNDKDVIAAFNRQQKEMEKERKAREELQKAINSNAAADREAKKVATDSAKATADEQRKLAAEAAKIAVAVRTPLESYKAGLKDLQTHLISGRLNQDQYRAAVDQMKASYDEATGKTEAKRKAQAADNAATKEAEAILGKLITREEQHAIKLAKLNELRAKGKLTAEQHAKATKAEKDSFDAATPQAATFGSRMAEVAAGVLGANAAMAAGHKVVAVLREEYDRLIERQNKAASVQISLAAAQEGALGNLDQSMTSDEFLKRMRDTSQQLGMSERDLTTAAGSALSAKGDKSAAEAVDAVVAAAKFKRFGSAEEKASLAGTALDFGKTFGFSPEESLGFLAGAQKTARVVSSKAMSENIAPAIINAGKFGVDAQTSAAMAASISSSATDITGAQTRTTMSALLEQLEKFTDGGTAANGLAAVQGSKLLREEFLSGASFEKAMIPAVRELLTPSHQGGFAEFQNAKKIMASLNPQQAFDEELRKKESSPAIRVAVVEQQVQNLAEQLRLNDPNQAMSGVVREGLKEVRDALGGTGIGQRVSGVLDDLRAGGVQGVPTAITGLQSEIQGIRDSTQNRVPLQFAGGVGSVAIPGSRRELTDNEQSVIQLLTRQIESLRIVAESMQAANGQPIAGGQPVAPANPQLQQLQEINGQLKNQNRQQQAAANAQQFNRQAGVVAGRMVAQGEGVR